MRNFLLLLCCLSHMAFSQEEWGQWNDELPNAPDSFSTVKEFEAFLKRPNRSSDSSREKAIKHWLEVTTGRDVEKKSNEDLLDDLAESLDREDDDSLEELQDSLNDFENDLDDVLDDAKEDLQDEIENQQDELHDELEDTLEQLEDDLDEDDIDDELDDDDEPEFDDDKSKISLLLINEKGFLV